ncbi:MAG: RHS repeat-associated core domain-containing protein [Bacteroidales bacterium]
MKPTQYISNSCSNECRFGFNGKEKDDETYGEGNEYDYGMRIYNPRIGRFFSIDPLTKKYPWYTPYQFAGNCPIWCVDLDGLEPAPRNYTYQERNDLFGDIDKTFVTDPYWTGINSASQVNYISKVGDDWTSQKVCSGDPSLPIKSLIKEGSRWSMNVTNPTSYNIDFNANQDLPVDDKLTKKTFADVAAAIQKNPNQIIQIQGNSNLSASGQLSSGNINGTEITENSPKKVSDLTNARAQTIYQGLINEGVPESNIQMVPGTYGKTQNTTLTVQERNDTNMPVKWEDLKNE